MANDPVDDGLPAAHDGSASCPPGFEPLIETARAATSRNANRPTPPTGATICVGAPARASARKVKKTLKNGQLTPLTQGW